jgi:ribosomal-protein-alanine N-acetyltransferase
MAPDTDERPDLTWLATERLEGQRIGVQHREALIAVFSDPRVAAWLGGEKPEAEQSARVDRMVAHWDEHGFGTYQLRQRGTAAVVGYAGLQWTEATGERQVEVLYGLAPAYWRQGYATEVTRVLLGQAFEQLGLDQVIAFTMTTNEGSQGVMRASGMAYVRELEHAGLPHVLYVLRRP